MRTDRPYSPLYLLYAARCSRGLGDGFAVVILPAYLTAIGFSPVEIGFVATASLFGTALLTLLVGFVAPRHDLRTMLMLGAGLMAATGFFLPGSEYLVWIASVAFFGTINPSTGDIGALVPLEHASLAQEATDKDRTRMFARYSLIGALSMAVGSLMAGLSDGLAAIGVAQLTSFRLMFYFYALLGVLSAVLYLRLPRAQFKSAHRPPPLDHREGSSIGWRRSSALTRSPAASSCSLCWRSGCSKNLRFQSLLLAFSSSGPAC